MAPTDKMKRIAQEWYGKQFSQLNTEQKFNVFDEAEWLAKDYDDERNRYSHELAWGFEPRRGVDPR